MVGKWFGFKNLPQKSKLCSFVMVWYLIMDIIFKYVFQSIIGFFPDKGIPMEINILRLTSGCFSFSSWHVLIKYSILMPSFSSWSSLESSSFYFSDVVGFFNYFFFSNIFARFYVILVFIYSFFSKSVAKALRQLNSE